MCVRELALQLISSWATVTNVQAEHGPSLFGADRPILFDLRLGPTKCFTQRGAWSCRRQLNGNSRLLKGKISAVENPSSLERHSISFPQNAWPHFHSRLPPCFMDHLKSCRLYDQTLGRRRQRPPSAKNADFQTTLQSTAELSHSDVRGRALEVTGIQFARGEHTLPFGPDMCMYVYVYTHTYIYKCIHA